MYGSEKRKVILRKSLFCISLKLCFTDIFTEIKLHSMKMAIIVFLQVEMDRCFCFRITIEDLKTSLMK
ncbi:hypothetical protein V1478_004479 [Vespula squamosa]|uniref:Uncharacterized protein n=1 Tax=Vespula squamosa TaxID=30214 RepID=A0ABD2BGB6_VESSQ